MKKRLRLIPSNRSSCLAQYAATGCLNSTFYATGEEQLETTLALCNEVDPAFIGKAAVYCREKGHMKDMPAILCAVLSSKDRDVFKSVFRRVLTNARMIRTFVQIMRSGATGRKSLGSLPKRLIQEWLASLSDEQVFAASVGNDPSLTDIVKMVHPKPGNAGREALYAYVIGKSKTMAEMPEIVLNYERFKNGGGLGAECAVSDAYFPSPERKGLGGHGQNHPGRRPG